MSIELTYEPDPALWLVGPTPPTRPFEAWFPVAFDAIVDDFGAESEESREYIGRVLDRFGSDQSIQLTERLLRWPEITEMPFPFWFGMVRREDVPPAEVEEFLSAAEVTLVEKAIVDVLPSEPNVSFRRSLAYENRPEGIVVSLRYVIDEGHPDVIVLAYTASETPGELIAAFDDVEALLRTVHPRGELLGGDDE